MAKSDIDARNRDELDMTLLKADKVIMKKYISSIDKRPILTPPYDISFESVEESDASVCVVGTNIMLAKLTRIVLDKEENILDKLTTVYCATSMYESATLVMLLKSNGKNIDVYLGTVCKKSDDSFVPHKQITALIKNFEANFPGSEVDEVADANERMKIVQGIFEKELCVASVTGIAALKQGDCAENTKYVQGLEKLADFLKGKSCTVMIIADPISEMDRQAMRTGYEELYTAIKPFEKSEYSVNSNNGKTVTDTMMSGVTNTVNESIAKTKTHTTTVGTNSAKTVGGSVGVNASTSTSMSASVGVGLKGTTIGASASTSVTVGVNASTDYHYTSGKHEDESNAEGVSETKGTSKALSSQNSIANALNSSMGEGLQITYENRSIKSMLEKIDLQIDRITECDDYGMFDCGVYFLSDDYTTCLSVASTYKSIIQGEHSSVETSHISIWDKESAKNMIPYLSTFNHPIFDLSDDVEQNLSTTSSTLVSGRELPIYMGLPKKSIAGVPVIECANFGRNVLYTQQTPIGKKIDFGTIHHMYADEVGSRVLLDKNSFTSHAFVTGSTGSGKSNAVYQLIDKMCFELCDESEKTHFMIVEPAKGEYKDVFGGYKDVQVFGTNPYHSKMLRINPFSFPTDIHVLEHIDRLIEIFNVCWPMYAAMPAVLKEAIERAYELAGWNLITSECKYETNGRKTYPNFVDVLNQVNAVINDSKYSADSKGDYVGALSMRVSSLTNGINGLILTSDELSYEELFDKNVIVDLGRVGSVETKSLLMGLLVVKLQEYRMSSTKGSNKALRHITVLEEAHNLLKRTSTEQGSDSSNLVGKSVEMLANAIAEMRTYGEGFIIVDQSPGLMDMSVIRNTNTKVILRLPDVSDRELVGKAANLNDNQIVELAKLKTGVCAVYQNNWIEPVLCHVDEWSRDKSRMCLNEQENILDSEEIKKQIIKLVLKTPHAITCEKVDELFAKIDKIRVSTELKVKLYNIVSEKDVQKYRNLRKSIIYEIFDPDTIMEQNIGLRNEIKEWCVAMREVLVPNLDEFEADEIQKILALLAYEKSRVEDRKEYRELLNNLVVFMDQDGRKW